MSFFSKSSAPIYIAGPCSVESKAQLHEIATAFKSMPIQFMRAGVWKPRTRPGSFEGLGEQALQWLSEIKKEFQIPIAIEVAEPAQSISSAATCRRASRSSFARNDQKPSYP